MITIGYSAPDATIWHGNVLDTPWPIESGSVQTCVTSPPYFGLRSYGVDGQLGLEATPAEFVANLVTVFREVKRVLRDDGTLWLNIGDSYAANRTYQVPDGKWVDVGNSRPMTVPPGLKPKDLMGMPWRLAFALQADGWYLRSDIIWHKKNCMPESVTDRPTSAHEHIFLLAKQERYFYDSAAVREKTTTEWKRGKNNFSVTVAAHGAGNGHSGLSAFVDGASANLRNVWTLGPEPNSAAHFAIFPTEIPRRAILAGSSEHGACSVCGAPWERVTETKNPTKLAEGGKLLAVKLTGSRNDGNMRFGDPRVTTTGFRPTCSHVDAPVRPCLVLDPFMGSGTTALVARQLGRHSVGLELNPEYIEISRKRLEGQAMSLFTEATNGPLR